MTRPPVTVLGAGIAGLAMATALAQRGFKVRVLEQAPEITEVGAGLQISPNGAVVLTALGMGEALDEAGTRARAVELVDGPSGDLVARIDLARRSFHFLHRADLIEMLSRAAWAAGATVELDRQVIAVDASHTQARLTFADGSSQEAPLLIAADGVHSVARAALGPGDPPRFSGQSAWRALVRTDDEPDNVVRVHMGPGRHLVHYPLANGRLINIVAVEERDDWVADGWQIPDSSARLRATFADFDMPVRDLLSRIEDIHLWGLHLYPVLRRWWSGPLCLIGDAAHPTLPFLAQGANMALEDAWVLARLVDEVPVPAAAFAAFEAQRKPRVTRIVRAARANARNYHLRGFPRLVGHAALRLASRWRPQLVGGRYDWIHGHDVTR